MLPFRLYPSGAIGTVCTTTEHVWGYEGVPIRCIPNPSYTLTAFGVATYLAYHPLA